MTVADRPWSDLDIGLPFLNVKDSLRWGVDMEDVLDLTMDRPHDCHSRPTRHVSVKFHIGVPEVWSACGFVDLKGLSMSGRNGRSSSHRVFGRRPVGETLRIDDILRAESVGGFLLVGLRLQR